LIIECYFVGVIHKYKNLYYIYYIVSIIEKDHSNLLRKHMILE